MWETGLKIGPHCLDSEYLAVSKYAHVIKHSFGEAIAQILYLVLSDEAFYFDEERFTNSQILYLRNERYMCQLIAH